MTCKPYVSVIAAVLLVAASTLAQDLTIETALDTLRAHEFGQHADVLDFLRDSASKSQTDPAMRNNLNIRFVDLLQSDASYAAKQFVCRLLVLTATEEQIPALAPHLSDPQMSHMALYVLTHLRSPAVDRALISALDRTKGNTKRGIITGLGMRRSAQAVKPLVSLLDSDQQVVAHEATLALGRIGTKECASALNRFVDQYQGALPGQVADAVLVCADNQASKDRRTAQAMYSRMLDRMQPSTIRCAALNGLAHLLGPESLSFLLSALTGDDAQLRQAAAQIARTLPGSDITVTLAQALNTFTPDTQVLVLKALGARGDTAALEGIRSATTHPAVKVRAAALTALASVGNESVIRLLADRAVNGTVPERTVAKHCLISLAGNGINAEMVTQLTQIPPAQQVVLIETLAKRQAAEAAQALLPLTQSDTHSVRSASLTALGALGSKDEMSELAGQLIDDTSSQTLTAQALVQIAQRTDSRQDVSLTLLEGLKTARTLSLKTTLLYTLGQLKHNSALPVLVGALKGTNETVRYNAIKALSAWPNASPTSDLLTVAQTASDKTHRVLALRGHLNLVSLSTLPAAEKLDHYQQAITLAPIAEKKDILAKLPGLQSAGALRMAAQSLSDPATANEAAQAVITLAPNLAARAPDATTTAMQQVIEAATPDAVKRKAQKILHQVATIKGNQVSASYQTLTRGALSQGKPWAVLSRDGASRAVKAYLSSLAQGETATGAIASPEFIVSGRVITFTLCGHDGQGGGRGEDFMALVDAHTGRVLKKTAPPGNDAMKTFTWDVSQLQGTRARIEVHDGNPGTAYAWLGVGLINASPAFNIDFSQGMPAGWGSPEQVASRQIDLVTDGVPFRHTANLSSLIPPQGSAEFACGFMADRLFFLGATVDAGQPGACYGGIELHYQSGSPDVFPLICAYTLNTLQDLASQRKATHLHATGSPGQFYLAITPRQTVIEKIRLVAEPKQGPIPHITAITCETTASHDRLIPLTGQSISPQEADWIGSHSISAESPDLGSVMQTLGVGQDKEAPVTFKKRLIDGLFRSEGVAVADFNGDDRLDIATGLVYYAGPDWTMIPMVNDPIEFNRNGYSSAFLCFAEDVDQDSDMDLIVVGFPGQQTHWLENPGQPGSLWQTHLAVSRTDNESPMYVDVTGNGHKELLLTSQGKCVMARPGPDPRALWLITPLSGPGDPAPGHGLGAGDLNGDGRTDVLIPNGWWEAPSGTTSSPWPFHKADLFGDVQLCVFDFDGDGDADVLGSSAHSYGIAWSEQTPDGWQHHEIDSADSQTHALHLADINRDGLMDFVTGKRFWAHNGHDPGSFQPAVLCWYEQTRRNGQPTWIKHIIDFDSGVGLHFQIVDINNDGRLDIVTSNKKGVYAFLQR
ncbi:MAG: hypothetical protein GY809_22185 [Planctomycetes bacterium]|nr:hypothetical protein [Planctomycetota bacterium]